MQVSSWEVNSSSAGQEINRILRNSTVHHRVKNSQSSALSVQCRPFHSSSSSNILMLPSHLHVDLPNCLFPSGFPTKTCTHFSSPIRATSPVHLIPLELITWLAVQIMKLLLTQFSPVSCYSSLSGPNTFPSTKFSNTPSLCSSLSVTDPVPHPYKTTGSIIMQ